jgi:hypothetical protein
MCSHCIIERDTNPKNTWDFVLTPLHSRIQTFLFLVAKRERGRVRVGPFSTEEIKIQFSFWAFIFGFASCFGFGFTSGFWLVLVVGSCSRGLVPCSWSRIRHIQVITANTAGFR